MQSIFERNQVHNGITYEQFTNEFERKAKEIKDQNLTDELSKYIVLNLQRTHRIHKTYKMSEEMRKAVNSISEQQTWVVITENWCGDSAQILPYIATIAKVNPNITFRIILRDSNLDIMENYLTNGTQSIPKLVAFDKNQNEIFLWGPRPKPAVELFKNEKEAGTLKEEIYPKLHLWYTKNKGKAIEEEFIKLLSS